MPSRPLSPHLSVYKFKYTLTSSILNRITGVGLSVGFLMLCRWLMAVAGGPLAQARAQRLFALPFMKVFYAALIFAFCYHFAAGIRHLVWDTGRGLERAHARASAWAVGGVSLLLSVAIAWLLWGRGP